MATCVYVALAGEDRICVFDLNEETGGLRPVQGLEVAGAPGPLATDPGRRFLYVGLRADRAIASLAIDARSGALSPLGRTELEADPCYLATDRQGHFLLAAYYRAGKVSVHTIDTHGVASVPHQVISTAPHAHCIQTDRSNRFAFVPHTMETNALFQFYFDGETGHLSPSEPALIRPDWPVGPRHFVFHPRLDLVYVSNEQGSSVTSYGLNVTTGILDPRQSISTLPGGYTGENSCAQIHLAPDGSHLYVSNRGHDSIAVFSVDMDRGNLTLIQLQATETLPRTFGLDPAGGYLFVAGQGSGRLATYAIDSGSGKLRPLATSTVGTRPMWVAAINLPEM